MHRGIGCKNTQTAMATQTPAAHSLGACEGEGPGKPKDNQSLGLGSLSRRDPRVDHRLGKPYSLAQCIGIMTLAQAATAAAAGRVRLLWRSGVALEMGHQRGSLRLHQRADILQSGLHHAQPRAHCIVAEGDGLPDEVLRRLPKRQHEDLHKLVLHVLHKLQHSIAVAGDDQRGQEVLRLLDAAVQQLDQKAGELRELAHQPLLLLELPEPRPVDAAGVVEEQVALRGELHPQRDLLPVIAQGQDLNLHPLHRPQLMGPIRILLGSEFKWNLPVINYAVSVCEGRIHLVNGLEVKRGEQRPVRSLSHCHSGHHHLRSLLGRSPPSGWQRDGGNKKEQYCRKN
eukprot:RCo050475